MPMDSALTAQKASSMANDAQRRMRIRRGRDGLGRAAMRVTAVTAVRATGMTRSRAD